MKVSIRSTTNFTNYARSRSDLIVYRPRGRTRVCRKSLGWFTIRGESL